MNEKIEAEITYTADEYARANHFILNRQFIFRYSFLWPITFLLMFLLVMFLIDPALPAFLLFRSDDVPLIVIIVGVTLLFMTILMVYQRFTPGFALRRNIKKQYNSSPALREAK